MELLSQDERNEYLRKRGVAPSLRQERAGVVDAPDPSRGGSRGYSVPHRKLLLQMWYSGGDPPCSLSSLRRWAKRLNPYEMSGGTRNYNMKGNHIFLLAFFKKIFPQASCSHCAVFIAIYSANNQVFTDNEISKSLRDMNMTRKRASTTAYQAFTPKNLHLHFQYWNYYFPGGIADVRRRDMIDVDECAIELKGANENYGHAVKNARVRKIGHYGRGKFKITLIMAAEAGDPEIPNNQLGSIQLPRIWYHLSTDKGTSAQAYMDFLKYDLMEKFNANERQRTILHDNLSSHKSDDVVEAVYTRGHRVKCRVPYRPHEAPIEYIFDMLACEIRRRWSTIHNQEGLIENIHDILKTRKGMKGEGTSFNDTFIRCGYVYDGEGDPPHVIHEGDRDRGSDEDAWD